MTEENRKQIIENINKSLNNKETLKNIIRELNELKKEPAVAKYISLFCEAKQIENDIAECEKIKIDSDDILEKTIYRTFKEERYYSSNCNHNVMIYNGTNVMPKHPAFANYITHSSPEENNPDVVRLHNCYKCLECDKEDNIKIADVKDYEQSHKILKRYDDEKLVLKCQKLYYKLLYNGQTSLEAEKQVCEQFGKENEKTLVKKRNI
ncbi:MAG: hypothetical protein E7170_03830 [Firmicutes bacterium]|nr:hypothetical protein [Bacillota bacterium]